MAALVAAGAGFAWYVTRPQPQPEGPWTAVTTVVAGNGMRGWLDGDSSAARFAEPFGIAVGADEVTYVADAGDSHRVRRISPSGTVTTLAGGGEGFRDGRGEAARFSTPSGLAIGPDGSLYVADTGNHAIRRISPDGHVMTVAGDGRPGDQDGPASQARFNGPVGLAVHVDGTIVVADTYNDRIRLIGTDGVVRTLAGSVTGLADGTGGEARFDTPSAVAIDENGAIVVADTGNSLLRRVDPRGVVSTVPTVVGLSRPIALTIAQRDMFVVDERGQVARIGAEGDAEVLAGDGTPGYANGIGSDARFRRPSGIARRGAALLVADAGNALIRQIAKATPEPRAPFPVEAWRTPSLTPPPSPRIAPRFDPDGFSRVPLLWPIWPMSGPHEVTGTFAEARGEAGQERFHAGLDVRQPAGLPVRAVRAGIVSSPLATGAFDTLNEWLRVGDLAYIHIRVGRGARMSDARFIAVTDDTGRVTRVRVRRGTRFDTGDVVGTTNRFNHVHLNVGWPGEEQNPLAFRLIGFSDTIAPTIAEHGVRLFDEYGAPLNPDRVIAGSGRGARRTPPRRLPPLEPVVVRGRVRVVVDAWDLADGNAPGRRLGVYALGYQVLLPDGRPAPGFETRRETIRFDALSPDPEAARTVFASGSGITVYGAARTRFLYTVTSTFRDGRASQGWWDTGELLPGLYVLRVFARDHHGNETHRDVRVAVTR